MEPSGAAPDDGPAIEVDRSGTPWAKVLEGFRSYLLAVADRRMDPDLAAKVGASDLVQETLLAAQLEGGAFRGTTEAELKSWLTAILRHLVANTRRHYFETAKRRPGAEMPIAGFGPARPDLPDSATSVGARAMREEGRASVTVGLASLPEHYRQVLLWRYQDQLTFEAIGDRLGKSADAARKLWGRAVVRLRETLGPDHASD